VGSERAQEKGEKGAGERGRPSAVLKTFAESRHKNNLNKQ